jgi:hypothetical protein
MKDKTTYTEVDKAVKAATKLTTCNALDTATCAWDRCGGSSSTTNECKTACTGDKLVDLGCINPKDAKSCADDMWKCTEYICKNPNWGELANC